MLVLNNNRDLSFKFKILSESQFKLILLIILILNLIFIPPISFTESIMAWNEIQLLNYFRAMSVLIICSILPGSNIYSLIFQKYDLSKRMNVSPFIFKSTIYPFLSFTILGIYTLILDQLGLDQNFFLIYYLILILFLFILDIKIQKSKTLIKIKQVNFKLSYSGLLFIFIIVGIALITLGIHQSSQFLIPGDSWRGINYSVLVGNDNKSYLEKFYTYEILYGCITFSLSTLAGMPYINLNVLMQIFLYLNLTSIYIFVRIVLHKFEKIYSQLTLIFIILFSELFYFINPELGFNISFWVTYDGLFCFRYKSLSYVLLYFSLALFVISSRKVKNTDYNEIHKVSNRLTLLGSWLFLNSFLIYYLPIIPGVAFIILFLLFSRKKEIMFSKFLILVLSFLILFIAIDLITTFFFSWNITTYLRYFTNLTNLDIKIHLVSNAIIIYLFLAIILILSNVLYEINKKLFKTRKIRLKKHRSFLVPLLGIISALLGLEILINIIFNTNQNFLTFYLHLFFSNIGIIGIIGIYLSYETYKEDKKLFYLLLTWFLFTFLSASFLIFWRGIEYPYLNPLNIPSNEFYYMMYWFNRIWFYSIIPLSILASIGIINLFKHLHYKRSKFRYKFKFKILMGLLVSAILIIFSFTNTILAGTDFYNIDYYVKNDEAQIMGWITTNTPQDSNFLINRWSLYYFFNDITFCNSFNIKFEINEAIGNYDCWETIQNASQNCSLNLIYNLEDHDNIIDFFDRNKNGSVNLISMFNSSRENGSIGFDIKSTNANNNFSFNFLGINEIYAFNLIISSNSLNFQNGSSIIKIANISNNYWNQINIDFECAETNYKGLDKNTISVKINNTEYGQYYFRNNITNLSQLEFFSGIVDNNWHVFIDNINFSWAPNLRIEKCIFQSLIIIDHLKSRNISYLIISNEDEYYKREAEKFIDIENDLIPNFYKEKLYEYGNLRLFFANETTQ